MKLQPLRSIRVTLVEACPPIQVEACPPMQPLLHLPWHRLPVLPQRFHAADALAALSAGRFRLRICMAYPKMAVKSLDHSSRSKGHVGGFGGREQEIIPLPRGVHGPPLLARAFAQASLQPLICPLGDQWEGLASSTRRRLCCLFSSFCYPILRFYHLLILKLILFLYSNSSPALPIGCWLGA